MSRKASEHGHGAEFAVIAGGGETDGFQSLALKNERPLWARRVATLSHDGKSMHQRFRCKCCDYEYLKAQRPGIHSVLQLLSLLSSSLGSQFGCLEPAVFFYLVVTDRNPGLFGAHHNHCLILTFDFPAITPDKKLTDIKFSHCLPSPG